MANQGREWEPLRSGEYRTFQGLSAFSGNLIYIEIVLREASEGDTCRMAKDPHMDTTILSPAFVKALCWVILFLSLYSLHAFFSDYRAAQQLDASPYCTEQGPNDCVQETKVTVVSMWIQKRKHVTVRMRDGSQDVVPIPDSATLGLLAGQEVKEAYWRGKVVYFTNKFGDKTITTLNPHADLSSEAGFGFLGALLAGIKILFDLLKSLKK
jgi:hypothetical protein